MYDAVPQVQWYLSKDRINGLFTCPYQTVSREAFVYVYVVRGLFLDLIYKIMGQGHLK